MKFEISGIKEIQKQLKDLEKSAKKLSGEINMRYLFNKQFMAKYTNFSSFEELLNNGGYQVNSTEDFEAIPDKEFDTYISKVTVFNNWKDMLNKATEKYINKILGF